MCYCVFTQETPGCSPGLACIGHGLGPGQRFKQETLCTWQLMRVWVMSHSQTDGQASPELSVGLSQGRRLSRKHTNLVHKVLG